MVTHVFARPAHRAMRLLLTLSLLFLCLSPNAFGGQDDLSAQVSKAVGLFSSSPTLARKELKELGPSAFPYLLRIIREDPGLGTIKKTLLIDAIARDETEKGASALVELLAESDPYVRGLAISYLGKRRYRPAISHLIKLLDDRGIFVTTIKTDPYREEPELVRDKAMEALQAITGKRMDRRTTQDERAGAWLRWWERQQRSK
jgi:hypothetical protein